MLSKLWPVLRSTVGHRVKCPRQCRRASQLAALHIYEDKIKPATFYKADVRFCLRDITFSLLFGAAHFDMFMAYRS